MKTSTIALLRMSKKKKKAEDMVQSATGKTAKVSFTKKICQTCNPMTETQPSDQKCHELSKRKFFFFCSKWLTDMRHFKNTPLCNFQGVTDYASLEVQKKKRQEYV